ncbi:hypothetical protein HPSA50_1704 [Helicobacter pylori SouthAfrica50]|uniref:Uncharacterized protein n=1 Tax=Helicobacter pylori SouthAfrica50 TaxID=1352357 RepID=T2SAD5_HELPX|nr:hypothetical protein HPSA50_1704 [Helicobacter pylori SouthAfrica50]
MFSSISTKKHKNSINSQLKIKYRLLQLTLTFFSLFLRSYRLLNKLFDIKNAKSIFKFYI